MHQRSRSLDQSAPLAVAAIAINAVFVALAALALLIRLISRRIQRLPLCFNDYAVLLAWPLVAAVLVSNFIVGFDGGSGEHLVDVDPSEIVVTAKVIPAATCLWGTANTLVKLSILHFYLTIFGRQRIFRHATYAVMVLVLSFGVGLILQAFLICRPFAKNWNPLLPGICGSSKASFLGDGIINVIIDVTMVILPMPMVWRLHMASQKKIALTAVFAVGILVCVITIIRIVIAVQFNINDYTYDIAKVSILTDLETYMGMIVACLPTFPPAFKRLYRGKGNSDSRRYISSSVARLRMKGPKIPGSRRLDDLYPLTDLEENGTHNEITGASGKLSDNQSTNKKLMMPPHSEIKIERGWGVRSDEAV